MQYVIPLVDGAYLESEVTQTGTRNNSDVHQIITAINGSPTTGKITIQGRTTGGRWTEIDYTLLSEVEPQKIKSTGQIDEYRFIVEGSPGTGSAIISDTELGESIQPYAFYGETNGMTPEEIGGAVVSANCRTMNRQEILTAIGDSITEQTNNFVIYMCAESQGGFLYANNAGVPGDTSGEVLARIDSAIKPDSTCATVMCLTNDVLQNEGLAYHRENMIEIINYIKAQGVRPIIILAPPTDYTDGVRTDYSDEMYVGVHEDYLLCRSFGLECYFPWYDFTDPDSFGWLAGSNPAGDTVHPNSATSRAAGVALSDLIQNNKTYVPFTLHNGLTDNVYVDNSCLLTDTNADGVPDGWTTAGAVIASSLSPTALGKGNTLSCDIANSSSSLEYARLDEFSISAGNKVLFSFRTNFTQSLEAPRFAVWLQWNNDSGRREYVIDNYDADMPDTSMAYETTVPSDATTVSVFFAARSPDGGATPYSCSFDVAQVQIFNITDYI